MVEKRYTLRVYVRVNLLAEIRLLSTALVGVEHVPFTPRHHRAWQQLGAILHRGVYLGHREPDEAPSDRYIEIAVWLSSTTGRGQGAYYCFRLERAGSRVLAASLFCYYNGDDCPGFRTQRAAAAFAAQNGFTLVIA
jgi:hypothetical protein